jgi:cardiolipin synthase
VADAMRTALVLLLMLPAVAQAAAVDAGGPLLVAVVPDLPGPGPGDEGFAVGCREACHLAGVTVTDGESAWAFPPGASLAAGGLLWVVANGTAWEAHDGPAPFLMAADLPRLANDGDDLALVAADGTRLDGLAYGDVPAADLDPPASPGLVLQRLRQGSGWQDTDSGDDWRTPRLHRIGESALPRPTFDVDRLTVYASPDSSFDTLAGLMASATTRLHLHVYELRSAALADRLVAAKQANPGLDLQVLVDANPVGAGAEDRHATADALRRIQAAGGAAVLAGNGRYDDHHLKVLVADDAVAVQSENWVPSGVPEDPTWGNRGWGVVLHDADAADWFAAWMEADREAWDVAPFDLASFDPTFQAPPREAPRAGGYGPLVPARTLVGPFRVTPVVAPDHVQDPALDPIAALAAGTTGRLVVQQLDLSLAGSNRLGWSGSDPLADALVSAAGRGAAVRVLAAAPFAADDTDNAEALVWLRERGVAGATFDRAGLVLHNKGLVADGAVVVGSLNGNLHSRAQNREVSLIVESAEAADYFAAAFEADWDGEEAPRDWWAPAKDLRGIPLAPWPILLAILGVVATRGRR